MYLQKIFEIKIELLYVIAKCRNNSKWFWCT